MAIKKIPRIFEHLEIAKRTCREIRILRHFTHDNIIAIRRIFSDVEVRGHEGRRGHDHQQQQQDEEEEDRCCRVEDVYIVLDLMDYDLHKCIYSVEVSNL